MAVNLYLSTNREKPYKQFANPYFCFGNILRLQQIVSAFVNGEYSSPLPFFMWTPKTVENLLMKLELSDATILAHLYNSPPFRTFLETFHVPVLHAMQHA